MNTPFNISKILIPIDFSPSSNLALEHAAILSSKFGISLHLLHVYSGISSDVLPSINASSIYVRPDIDQVKTTIADELNKLGSEYGEKYDINFQIEVRGGNVSKEITRAAEEHEIDLIVMGTHGVSGFEEFFLGSNAYRVVTAAKQPVLTVQSHAKKVGYENIILPIDSTIHTRDKVSHAALIAEKFGATVHILGLITEEHEEEQAIYNLKIKQIENYLQNKSVNFKRKIIHCDDIADATIGYAERNEGDLIVMMTEQEASTGLFVGPYAQRIVNHSKVPVMSVTPIQIITSFSRGELGGDYRPFHI